uniref:Retrovirus-related Pol polyprotein from transposon TNT 1-94 n=1 Tax=Tanacetum cinerariifolium TaxID=118510 RepID=A0A6L2M795_TANCI|nr:hypothetical protein [Tanacetum cinerariifolium]
MADVNVNAPADQAPTMAPPTRTDDQILPHIRWVPIGKSHCYLDVEKSQSNPIYKIAVDILKHTNFFRAFTASSTIPSIYIQQDSFQITPVNNNKAFSSPPSSDALINFVNKLGYPKLVKNLSNVVTNDMFQPWRTLTTIINLCLTGKTSGFERPRALMLQILWGKKHKFHPRPDSSLPLPNEEPVLGYLKFSARGTMREVFGMPIPGSDPDSPASKTTKTTKKSKPTAPKADPRPPVSKPASSQQPEPKPTPAKTQGKKRIPEKEPRFDDEEADVQRVLEESLKSIYDVPRGPVPSVVIREPESRKYQPLTELQGKGKEKITEDQVARDLLTLQTPKKKSFADQYIFQRCTSTPTGSSGHDESSSLYAELGLTDNKVESDEDVPRIDAGVQVPQPLPSPVVRAGPNLKHMDFEVAYVSTQPHPEQMDEGFTATAYSKVQENLKLTIEKQVILEEPASSTWTLSSLQHLAKDLNFGDLFFNDKPPKSDNEKTTAKTEAESMVSVTIRLDTSAIPPMPTPIINLTSRPESPNVHRPLQSMATETPTTTTTTIHPPPSQPQQSTTDFVLMKSISKLEHIMANLIQENKHLEERLDSHGACL